MDVDSYVKVSQRTASGEFHQSNVSSETLHGAIGLAGESGEILDCIKKSLFYGIPLDRENLREEIGDSAWYLALLCNSEGWSLSEILEENVEKLTKRYPEKFTRECAELRFDKGYGN